MSELRHHGDLPESRQRESQADRVQSPRGAPENKSTNHEDQKCGERRERALAQSLALRFRAARLIGRSNGSLQRDHQIAVQEDQSAYDADHDKRKLHQYVTRKRGDPAHEKHAVHKATVQAG